MFHVVFVIKMLLYIEFKVFRKKKKGLEMKERPKKRLHVWSRQSSFLVLCCDRNSWVATWFSDFKQ